MATFASDNFTDTAGTTLQSHTPSGGGSWTRHGSYSQNLVISDANRCRGNSFNDSLYYHSGSPASAEYDVQAVIRARSNNGHAGVCARVDATLNSFYFARFASAVGWRLEKVSSGSFTVLGTDNVTDGTSLALDTDITLKLECRDATKKLFRNGVELLSSSNNDITATGKAGLRINTGTNTTGYHLDDFQASDPASGAQTISGAGAIASGEAFGAHRLDLAIAASGLASSEAFGTALLALAIGPAGGIASAEAFGSPALALGIVASNVPTGEVFGTARLDLAVSPSGIASAETFGTAIVDNGTGIQSIVPTGIASAEAFGAARLDLTLLPAGIATAEVFGTARLDLAVSPSGIASAEVFGAARLDLSIAPAGMASGENLGTPAVILDLTISPAAIPGGESFGAARLDLTIAANGLGSAEVFGTARLDLTLLPLAAGGGESFGVAVISGGAVAVIIVTPTRLVLATNGRSYLAPASSRSYLAPASSRSYLEVN